MARFSSLALVLSFVLSSLAATPMSALDAPLPRHPAPSPDASQILFSWQGDLWQVAAAGGEARRLTVHPAPDRFPVWSRDGQWIAFSSGRQATGDVYVMPADASATPRRLTHASVEDRPAAFTPDGQGLLFTSRRDESFRRHRAFYTVPLTGGTPALALPSLGLTGSYSPDGTTVAFVRGSTGWDRRGYRGSANRDLWLHWPASGEFRQITDFDGDDDRPFWIDDDNLLFLSSRAGRKNLFRLHLPTGEATQLTSHEGSDVRFPNLSADGTLAAYEFEDGLWTVATAGGAPQRISVQVTADTFANPLERRVSRDKATELAVHPAGELAAFVVHGDIFLVNLLSEDEQKIAPPATVRITDTPRQERDISWSPDGESLLLSSDTTGSGDLYRIRRGDKEIAWENTFDFPWQQLTSDPRPEAGGRMAPDGKHIAFVRGGGDLVVADADGGNQKTLLEHWSAPDFNWSPDGKWIAYAIPDEEFNTDIWLRSVDGDEAYNVSRHPDDDVEPHFTPDGRRLAWLSKRRADTVDLWSVWLRQEDHERTPASWLAELRKEKDPKQGGKGKGKDEAKEKNKNDKDDDEDSEEEESKEEFEPPKIPEMHIDLDGLWERAEAITELKGDEQSLIPSPDSRTFYFTADNRDGLDLYSISWNGKDLTQLTRKDTAPAEVQISQDSKTIFFLNKKGQVKRIDPKGKGGDPTPFAARYAVDRRQEAEVVFDEVWSALDENFYDPEFHGVDWAAQREQYKPWALEASHPKDFEDVVNLMLGELNASHMGYFLRQENETETTGWIGALFAPPGEGKAAAGSGLLVREVLPHSPAALLQVNLQAGDRLLAVNDEEITATTNVYSLFADTVDQRVRLRIKDASGGERTATVIPIALNAARQLRYRQWIRERQEIVKEASGGRLGYLHIQGMNIPSYEEFERSLYTAGHGKEGMVIDVRSNGGGWTTDYLMAALTVRRHARTVPRGADPTIKAYPQSRLPLAAWTRPAVTICDQDSYSNAEIFSWAFQTLGRGQVVGTPTFGAVISTGGTRLINGGFVRQPFRGWYVAGSDINMELNGAVPDVLVTGPPSDDFSTTADAQLSKAVEVLLEELETDSRAGAW